MRPGSDGWVCRRVQRERKAAREEMAIRLWPHACPMLGRASYSALKIMEGPLLVGE